MIAVANFSGDVIIYQWVECIKDYLNDKASTIMEEMEMAHKSTERELTEQNTKQEHLSEDLSHDSQSLSCDLIKNSLDDKMTKKQTEVESESIIHGEPLTDRKSTFQAHVAEVHSMDEVERLLSVLKSNRKIAVATHNILAYRYFDEVKGVVIQDCDDDGESAAGGRLLHLLQIMDVLNIMVVVSRWYGGIHLGPDRFKHINNVARVLLQHTGIGSKGLTENQGNQKRKLKKRL